MYHRVILLLLCTIAGTAHVWAAPEHFAEWWGYGSFFAVVGALQILYGGSWLVLRFDFSSVRVLAVLGIIAHAGLIGLYIITRTIGIPPIGPEAGEIEPVQAIDLVSKASEALLILLLLLTLRDMRNTWKTLPEDREIN